MAIELSNIRKLIVMSKCKRSWSHYRNVISLFFKHRILKATGSLSDFGQYFGTDKVNEWHTFKGKNYLDIYEIYFKPLREKQITLLEIGVRDGSSLKMWESYFSSADIYGLDIDPRCQEYSSDRISIFTGSQDDESLINELHAKSGNFDIVIDDGSHVNELTLASFSILFEKLKPGGIYIIEDLGCSYTDLSSVVKDWPGMQHNASSVNYNNDRVDMDRFFLEKIKEMDHLRGDVRSIQFWPLICCIVKA